MFHINFDVWPLLLWTDDDQERNVSSGWNRSSWKAGPLFWTEQHTTLLGLRNNMQQYGTKSTSLAWALHSVLPAITFLQNRLFTIDVLHCDECQMNSQMALQMCLWMLVNLPCSKPSRFVTKVYLFNQFCKYEEIWWVRQFCCLQT